MKIKRYLGLALIMIAGLLAATSVGMSPPNVHPLVRLGQVAPGTKGAVYSSFGPPAGNSIGQVAFPATLEGSAIYNGLFLSTSAGVVTPIALFGETLSNSEIPFSNFGQPAINDSGQIAFSARLGTGYSNQAICLFSVAKGIQQIARTGQKAPGTTGRFMLLGQGGVGIDNSGRLIFQASYGQLENGIFEYSFNGLRPLALFGQEAPDTNGGRFERFRNLSLTANGNIAFLATVSGGSTSNGVFKICDGNTSAVALRGSPALYDKGGVFEELSDVSANNDGSVSFVDSSLISTSHIRGAKSSKGIFSRLQTTENISRIASNAGLQEVLPVGNYHDPTKILTKNGYLHIFRGWNQRKGENALFAISKDKIGILLQEGQSSPIGGRYSFISKYTITNSDHLVFISTLVGASTKSAIFILDMNF